MPLARLTINSTIGGSLCNNVLGYSSPDPWTPAECGLLAEAIAASWLVSFPDVQSDAVQYTSFDYLDLIDGTIGGSGALAGVGALGQPSVPTFAAVKIQFNTALHGRAYTGRTGVTGAPENQTDASDPNALTPTYRASVQTAASSFVTTAYDQCELIIPGAGPAVISTVSGGILRDPPIATPVASALVLGRLGTRRSRLD